MRPNYLARKATERRPACRGLAAFDALHAMKNTRARSPGQRLKRLVTGREMTVTSTELTVSSRRTSTARA